MLEVELIGTSLLRAGPSAAELERLCILAASARGVADGHLAVEFIEPERIAALNREHRGKAEATDVLSFPIDGLQAGPAAELGDVVICPQHTEDVPTAVVHGVLHLLGMDHESDNGEMLALQERLLTEERS